VGSLCACFSTLLLVLLLMVFLLLPLSRWRLFQGLRLISLRLALLLLPWMPLLLYRRRELLLLLLL
jgi:hypothetical protein